MPQDCGVSPDLIKHLSSQASHFYILHEQKAFYLYSKSYILVCYAAVNTDSLKPQVSVWEGP